MKPSRDEGHSLSTKDTIKTPPKLSFPIKPPKEDNLSTKDKITGPNAVSFIQRFQQGTTGCVTV